MTSKHRWIALTFAIVVALGAAIAMSARRDGLEPRKGTSETDETTPPKQKIEEALKDASLLDLIRNARVATRKGDQVTRTAMVAGLRKDSERAKTLLQREIGKAKDPTDREILTKIGTELP